MNGAAGQGQPQAQPRPQNQALQNLIRPEQVSKLPHLTQQQKTQTEQRVKNYWEFIHAHSGNPSDPKYIQASQELARLSNTLMQGMKAFNQQKKVREQQQQQMAVQGSAQGQAPAQAGQMQQPQQAQPRPAGQQTSGNVTFSQLMPEVQQRVNQQQFFYPPAMNEGSAPADQWLQEAKARFGQAIQRAQMAKTKKIELQRAASNRTSGGNPLSADEQAGLQVKLASCDKAMRESQNFMEKFKEQQEQFKKEQMTKAQRSQQRFSQPGQAGQAAPEGASASEGAAQNTQMQQQSAQGPQPLSIASAQAAARANAASAGNVNQPGASQPGSATVTGQQQTPIDQAQGPFNASSGMMSQTPSRPNTAAGPQSAVHPSASLQASHAHPSSNNVQPLSGAVNGMNIKTQPPQIPKNLHVAEPQAVPMPPARPTLNGGANVGMSGQLTQPALTTFPGFVLEQSEDGHLLSKKKLNDLVREVLGPNSEDQLTAEAEEICLSLVDDFVDDLLTASCRLAKLRTATSLEAKDVQVILERQYNIRVPGFSTDEVRIVRKNQPAAGWAHKVGAVQAAKLMNGSGSGNALSSGGGNTAANGGS